MNQANKITLSLAESLLKLFFITFPKANTSEEKKHSNKETAKRSLKNQHTFSKEYRTTELVTGLIGSVLGVASIVLALVISEIGSTTTFNEDFFGSILIFASPLLAIVGVFLQGNYPKLGGLLVIIAAIEGFVFISLLYVLSGILLLISGSMGLLRGSQIELYSLKEKR